MFADAVDRFELTARTLMAGEERGCRYRERNNIMITHIVFSCGRIKEKREDGHYTQDV